MGGVLFAQTFLYWLRPPWPPVCPIMCERKARVVMRDRGKISQDFDLGLRTLTTIFVSPGPSGWPGNLGNCSKRGLSMSDLSHLRERGGQHTAYTSGITGHKGNGHISVAYLLIGPDGSELLREFEETQYWGSLHDAEYLGVQRFAETLKKLPPIENLSLRCSSRFVVNQLQGAWRINVDRHQCFVTTIKSVLRAVNLSVTWVPGKDNPIKSWHWENYNAKHSEVKSCQEL